jgi:hypothetical protein
MVVGHSSEALSRAITTGKAITLTTTIDFWVAGHLNNGIIGLPV